MLPCQEESSSVYDPFSEVRSLRERRYGCTILRELVGGPFSVHEGYCTMCNGRTEFVLGDLGKNFAIGLVEKAKCPFIDALVENAQRLISEDFSRILLLRAAASGHYGSESLISIANRLHLE